MTLDDLIEDTSIDRFTEEGEEEEDRYEYYEPHADFDREEKPCPTCMCISQKKEGSNIWYECPYDDCGIVLFMSGWNEYRFEKAFLGTVEVTGWRLDDE